MNAAGIDDQNGNPGSGTVSTSWLMDTTPPTSTVNPLPQRGTSLTFAVSVTGSDGGSPASGVKSYDIYSSTNGGAWTLWTTVPASNPTANFTGQSNTTYAFYSTATDNAGNTEAYKPQIEASTYLPDLTPPVTSVDGTTGTNPSTVNTATGTFTLNLTGKRSRRRCRDLLRGLRVGRFRAVHAGRTRDSRRTGQQRGECPGDHSLPGPHRRRQAHLRVLQHRPRQRGQHAVGTGDPQSDAHRDVRECDAIAAPDDEP